MLAQLVAVSRLRIGDEESTWRGAGGSPGDVAGDADELPFAKSTRKRRFPRHVATSAKLPAMPQAPEMGRVVTALWSKRLSDSDALRPPNPKSKVTGALRLGKAGFDIDKETYFIDEFFAALPWAQDDKVPTKSYCVAPFECTLAGEPVGVHNLKVDHKASRVAKQNNVPTVLHWGSLSAAIREGDYREHWVVLSAFTDGTYSLEIKSEAANEELPPTLGQ